MRVTNRIVRAGNSLLLVALFGCGACAVAQSVPALVYTDENRGPVPIPPSERGLQTVSAEPWMKVSEKDMQVEGAAFDRGGNLHFVDVYGGRVLRVTPDKRLTVVFSRAHWNPSGITIHKDGRLFVAAVADGETSGSVLSMHADGSDVHDVVSPSAGYRPNDLVFDARGGFYFSDFRGISTDPQGGIDYVSPGTNAIAPVLPHLAMGNGVALSPNGKTLWATEYGRNLLHRADLKDATTLAPFSTSIPYQFIGTAPDSMRADTDGNLYIAIYGQGRVLVVNGIGIPIGQILLPGRREGHYLHSTSMALLPGTDDLYIVSNDAEGGEGAEIFRVKGFSKALTLYSHQ